MKTLRKLIPLTKVDEKNHLAYGVVTGESPDKEGEICDYKFAKASYQAWSNEASESTLAAGQELSLGNIRLQHTLRIAGKAVQLDFDDEKKTISLGSSPVDDATWKLVKGGFVRGYSQGGSYAFRKCSVCETDMPEGRHCPTCDKTVYVRYGPVIEEVSYVDNPCYKAAKFSMVKGMKFVLLKSDGSSELKTFAEEGEATMAATTTDMAERLSNMETMLQKALQKDATTKRVAGEDLTADCFAYVGDKEKTATWKFPISGFSSDDKTKRHIRNALSRWSSAKGIPDDEKPKVKAKIIAAAKKHGVEVSEDSEKALKAWSDGEVIAVIEKTAEGKGLKKGMYEVQRFASILQDLAYIRISSEYEREREQDDSTLPEDLQQDLESLAECFLSMAEEETKELTIAADNSAKNGGMYMAQATTELQKAARKSLSDHVKAMKDSLSAHCDKMCKAHTDHKEAMHAGLDKLHKILGTEEADADGKSKAGTDEPEPIKLQTEGTPSPLTDAAKSFVSIGKTADGVEVFKKVTPAAVADGDKPLTKADLETFGDEMFNAGIQSVLKTLSAEEDAPAADGVKKANAGVEKAADGVGDRRGTTLLNAGPVLRVMPVRKSDDGGPAAGDAAQVVPAADLSKVMNGDREEQLKFMRSATPAELPATVATALGGRHHSAI